jgi:uncharacterized membrane protein YbhN (UPF0104 family)
MPAEAEPLLERWRQLPLSLRRGLTLALKAGVTVACFWALLRHGVPGPDGVETPIWRIVEGDLGGLSPRTLLPLVALAALVKALAILASMLRWQLLLRALGIRFDLWHVVGAFLTGRFVGTFLPSTVGLDGYKLYDAARFSGRVVEPAAATAVEKLLGVAGLFLAFLVGLPLGSAILGPRAALVVGVTVPVVLLLLVALFLVLLRPGGLERLLPRHPGKALAFVSRLGRAATAYRGRGGLLALLVLLSFLVHFGTAAMYWFTARAVGATGASFWEVVLASTIQIVATVLSPFTIAGEGVREVVQALLLASRIGAGASVLSGALGFWAAEVLTLVGGVFLWTRRADYRPRVCEVRVTAGEGAGG